MVSSGLELLCKDIETGSQTRKIEYNAGATTPVWKVTPSNHEHSATLQLTGYQDYHLNGVLKIATHTTNCEASSGQPDWYGNSLEGRKFFIRLI